jgi:mono/diheme cytochrome c family protein
MRLLVFATCIALGTAVVADAQQTTPPPAQTGELVRKGHDLAVHTCAICHIAAPDQPSAPLLEQPAPSFESIAQRKDTTADSLRIFMTTTHRGLDAPKGMPDPMLMDYQLDQIIPYILSLRK